MEGSFIEDVCFSVRETCKEVAATHDYPGHGAEYDSLWIEVLGAEITEDNYREHPILQKIYETVRSHVDENYYTLRDEWISQSAPDRFNDD